MLTSGVILDQYDDPNAVVLQQHFSSGANMPDLLKTAGAVEDPSQLPDEAFALIAVDNGLKLRKYAMCDPVTAARSAFYFMTCGGRMPLEAQKVAAANLSQALLAFEIQPPEAMLKLAQELPPAQENIKTSSVVDTTGQHAPDINVPEPRPAEERLYALVKEGECLYPIDTLDRVYRAVDYFDRYEHRFNPMDRREYCTKVAARMDELGQELPQRMRDYAAQKRDSETIALAIYKRAEAIPSSHELQAALYGLSKEAVAIEGEMLVALFEEFDKQAGLEESWDMQHGVPNPVLSVYREKTAQDERGEVLWEEGNDRMTRRDLISFTCSTRGAELLKQTFSRDLADSLLNPKNQESVFNSLPDPHKIMIARLVADNSDGVDRPHGPQ